jgi:hypothetical protein
MPVAIWAPHPDDEIIGCHSILVRGGDLSVHYGSSLDDPGIARSSKLFKFVPRGWAPVGFYGYTVYAPDPLVDYHPLHQHMGQVAQQLFRDGTIFQLIHYTTTMLGAPYIFEVSNPELKKASLNACYPEKSDLWKYEHKYFLFEGYCEWHRPG